MLTFDKVSTFYGKIQALHEVSLEVTQGEIVTLIGANGAGKSTLLMTLCGSPRAASGSIRYEGEELVGQESCDIMRKSIAVVPEGRRVFARLTVEENLAMGGFFTAKGDFQDPGDLPGAYDETAAMPIVDPDEDDGRSGDGQGGGGGQGRRDGER